MEPLWDEAVSNFHEVINENNSFSRLFSTIVNNCLESTKIVEAIGAV